MVNFREEITVERCIGAAAIAGVFILLFYGCPTCRNESLNKDNAILCNNKVVENVDSKVYCSKAGEANKPPAPVGFVDATAFLHYQKLFEDWILVPNHEYIHKLQIDDLAIFLDKHPAVLIMFYESWCPYSENSKVPFAQAAYTLTKENVSATFAAINCEINVKVCTSSGLSGYPTFKVYRKGVYVEEYLKSRNAKRFVNLMRMHSQIGLRSFYFF